MPNDYWLSDDGKKLTEEIREKLQIQPWSHELCEALNSGVPMGGWEAIFPRINKNGEIEVLLPDRSENDNTWPGQPAVPGSLVRKTDVIPGRTSDEIDRVVLNRIFSKELNLSEEDIAKIKTINCGVVTWLHDRGPSISNCFICILDKKEFPVGKWYNANNLPENLLGGQDVVVEKALDWIREYPRRKELLPVVD